MESYINVELGPYQQVKENSILRYIINLASKHSVENKIPKQSSMK